ncbi:phosphate-starvation-inducible PsiE family protein [Acetobacter orientalis]|nr:MULTISPECIES: phosphate-starvation-inducible PsiE family protein [Acetobacter]MCP1217276.1 phosphate-starvation-inducible PsiE family protein [Acetobacter orientalis]MCP1220171.1 phosphate-starvation-inducible PsiE family protein [Acetobacter orientalis]MCP1232115.1 phosphate-starvation-inducible PsiE family protein [Acetobacter indonesiensis]
MIKNIPGFLKLSAIFDLFEEIAMLVLTLCIMVVAALGLIHVLYAVFEMLRTATLSPTNPVVLQSLFGLFFTVLIALEFKHSILVSPDTPSHSMVRMRSVLLIGMMATVRKFIVLDLSGVDVMEVLALSAAILALGSVYWLVRGGSKLTSEQ